MNTPGADQNSSGLFGVLRWLLVLAVPLTVALYALSWNQLPERMATHFGASGQANGWMSRQDSLVFCIVLTSVLSVVGIVVLSHVKKPDLLAWGGLGFFYFVIATILWGTNAVIGYNVSGRPVDPAPIAGFAVIAIVLSVAFALLTRPGTAIPSLPPFAHETHGSPIFAFLMLAVCAVFVVIAANIPVPAARIALGAASFVIAGAAVMAWSGFQYLFSKSGLEIRTLGFHLRSIPAADIRSYAVDHWNTLGGYGIRGIGNKHAYVWGNRGVRIQTSEGEVFLGHSEPGRIMRDLERITGSTAAKQVLN